MSRADGVGGVIRAAVAEALPQAAQAEQAELFNLPITRSAAESDAAFAARSERAHDLARRQRGRPKGAQSVSTTQWRDFALKHGPHPVVAMMRWLDLGPHGLAEELDITLKEAFVHWTQLARELAPYFMAKQAPVDDTGKAVPGLAIFTGGAGVNTEAGQVPPWMAAFRTMDGEFVDVTPDVPAGPADAEGGSASRAQEAEGGSASRAQEAEGGSAS